MSNVNSKIFKTYDVRGKYPDEITEADAKQTAKAFAKFLNVKNVVVGYDMRVSSKSLHSAAVEGLVEVGVKVLDIGMVSTPMLYFGTAHLKGEAGIMITASHNPKNYGGMKFIDATATPIFSENGLKDIAKIAEGEIENVEGGSVEQISVEKDYVEFLKNELKDIKSFKIVMDPMHGAIGPVVEKVFSGPGLEVSFISTTPDGELPGYKTPNPILEENQANIKRLIAEKEADMGLMWDGDGDRLVVLDSKGEPVYNAFIAALIAKEVYLETNCSTVVSDIRMNKILLTVGEDIGLKTVKVPTGNPFVKIAMEKANTEFGGESSGHFMFKKTNYAEDTIMAAIYLLKNLTRTEKSPQDVFDDLRASFFIGVETNFEIEDKDGVIEKVRAEFGAGKEIDEIDGVSMEDADTWINIRKSNTEPLIRLNVQASSGELLESTERDVKEFIEGLGGVISHH